LSGSAGADRRIVLGRICGLYGVRGWVRIESWTQPRERIFQYRPWLLKSAAGEREIDGFRGRVHGKGLVAALPGVDDREAAAALIGSDIEVWRSALPGIEAEDGYYWADLEGLEVVNGEGIALGRVSHLIETGANDVLVVHDGNRERLIPFVPGSHVIRVDLGAGRIDVDWDADF
jgi:16S rRNA processing protein RimM